MTSKSSKLSFFSAVILYIPPMEAHLLHSIKPIAAAKAAKVSAEADSNMRNLTCNFTRVLQKGVETERTLKH